MKICFFSPYIGKHFGGGEKYLLDCARIAAEKHEVFVAISSNLVTGHLSSVLGQYEDYFGFSLEKVTFVSTPLSSESSFLEKLIWTKQFDCIYYETDGSLFFSLAKKNIFHIQIPFTNKLSIFSRLKLLNWQILNTNSEFTKKIIEKHWQTNIDYVHQPMIAVPSKELLPKKKEKIILNVGRFFSQLHSKRQDILLTAFAKLINTNPSLMKGWKLILVGSVEDDEYFQKIKNLSKNLPVKIIINADRKTLEKTYARASIYWHATGFASNEFEEPEKQEHFGISTLEAMSYGAVPVVCGQGGQLEIVTGELAALTWKSEDELITNTLSLIKNEKLKNKYEELAKKRAQEFTGKKFKKILFKMLET